MALIHLAVFNPFVSESNTHHFNSQISTNEDGHKDKGGKDKECACLDLH